MQSALIEKTKYDVNVESLGKSAKNFEKVQVYTIDAGIVTVEKMAFYSAGAISLSITFLGYIIANYKSSILQSFLFLPAYYFLYASWFLFVLTIVTGIMVRRLDAFYRYYAASKDYFLKRKNEKEQMIKLVDTDYPLILDEGATKESYKEQVTGIIDIAINRIDKDKKNEIFYFKLKLWIQNIATISFILSIFLLILFATIITNKIIK